MMSLAVAKNVRQLTDNSRTGRECWLAPLQRLQSFGPELGAVEAGLLLAAGNQSQMTTKRPDAAAPGAASGGTVRLNQDTPSTRRL
jgi:hypothetical protein